MKVPKYELMIDQNFKNVIQESGTTFKVDGRKGNAFTSEAVKTFCPYITAPKRF